MKNSYQILDEFPILPVAKSATRGRTGADWGHLSQCRVPWLKPPRKWMGAIVYWRVNRTAATGVTSLSALVTTLMQTVVTLLNKEVMPQTSGIPKA